MKKFLAMAAALTMSLSVAAAASAEKVSDDLQHRRFSGTELYHLYG